MADYSSADRYYGGRQPGYPQRQPPQRDAAFQNIFGGAPPPGRSQTMTSDTQYLIDQQQQQQSHPRLQSLTSSGYHPDRPPPHRVVQPSYDRTNGSAPGPPGPYMSNGMSGTGAGRMPPPVNPPYMGRPPYPPPQGMAPGPGGPMPPYQRKPVPNRMPPPAMNNDSYRSRSMVQGAPAGPPQFSRPPQPMQGTAGAFRQQPYQSMGPRTTSQGRAIPDRSSDRAMTMGSYSSGADGDHVAQLTSGRIVPGRRRESGSDPFSDHHTPLIEKQSYNSPTSVTSTNSTNSLPVRRPPSNGSSTLNTPGRSVSAASAASGASAYSNPFSDSNTLTNGQDPSRADSMRSNRPTMGAAHSSQMSGGSDAMVRVAPVAQRRSPLVYPALLSRVAEAFQERIPLGPRTKNDLEYKSAFTGAEAVDLIAYIIKTTDRNLALLLGRALDAQKFFHDVTYEHRLRDAQGEVYQFKETIGDDNTSKTGTVDGVFTLLTECYSPTCTKDQLCYSIACPRRLEQQARLNMKPQPGLRHSASKSSLHDEDQEQKLWINSVPKEVADKIDDKEKKRQEVISELMYTERDFVKDLEYLRDFWIRPLRGLSATVMSPIREEKREKFVRTVFGNSQEVLAINSKFADELSKRQKEQHVVNHVGDVFLRWVPQFDPFIKYGANQMYGKYEFEREKSTNPAFSRFVDETERLKESRKLELNGYLTKPTTRLARYPLLLEGILKYTKDDNPDKKDIPLAIGIIRDFLAKVNAESGKAENHFNLLQLSQQLKWNPGEYTDLKLTEDNRVILTKMSFKKTPGDSAEVIVYLFDHAVLMCRNKMVSKREELRVYRKPIPLELLMIAEMGEVIPRLGIAKRPSSGLLPGVKAPPAGQKEVYPITFKHLGKGAYELQLYAPSVTQRKKFIEMVEEQQTKLRQRSSNFYTKTILCENFFNSQNRVNCLVPTDGGRKLVYGSDNGVYTADRWPKDKSVKPKRILDAPQVSQIETLEEYRLLLVLSNKNLQSYPFEALDPQNQNSMAIRPRKIQGHSNFFKAGIGLGRHLVCTVKTSALSTTIKVYEPINNNAEGKKKPALSKMFASGQETLKPFKVTRFFSSSSRKPYTKQAPASDTVPLTLSDTPNSPMPQDPYGNTPVLTFMPHQEFYIPSESSSVHYLRSTLCVGCARGFEVVSLETTERQSLLDQADTSLDFVTRKENVKPIHIERLNGEFLLNYSDFSFFVNRNGWRARQDWKIVWEGTPQSFALNYPYILAFEPSFIEIRHIETSELCHIITGRNVRMLHSSTREILYAYEDDNGEDVIASLDFWQQAP
ncbi:Rho1 guanine nucleotide exchange factor 1 [Cyphellophora attinorum]|uniref:Rho1 guanine nucleotide exchange factor 1 n=1 Tax=Cyphellophora attinorum TaxID=1664694 RepID=A0A0N0NPB8_9EURO|nr:Rho1 guanine nucleotide exchange factor 1 [Phialophora attinorum]KPI42571.1 Rho1 guanine nucleotide exchange factor 1 [Phialophora attinorum]